MLYNLALLLPSSVCFTYSIQSLCKRKENSRSQNILAFCLLFTSISLFILAARQAGVIDSPAAAVLDVIDAFITPLLFPLMYFYLKSLTCEKPFRPMGFLWLVPAIGLGTSTLVICVTTGGQPPVMTEGLQSYVSLVFYGWMSLGIVVINIYAALVAFRYFHRPKKSDSTPCIVETPAQVKPRGEVNKEEGGPIQKERYDILLASFDKLMDKEQLYLKNDLRADEVAHLMFTNRKYVTLIIKEQYQCSFSDYVNARRIEYSMELMRLNPTLKQYQLAEQSGFQSASTFSKTFKQMIGITPKDWCRSNVL